MVGDPGIGKTRLVHAALARCAPTLPLVVGTGVEAEQGIPFHVFRHAFGAARPPRADPRRHPGGGAEPDGALLPRVAGPVDVRLFRTYQLARRLLALAARDGLTLVLDDLHWADVSSIGLVTHLLRYPVPAPLLLILAYRPRQMATAMPFGPPDTASPQAGVGSGSSWGHSASPKPSRCTRRTTRASWTNAMTGPPATPATSPRWPSSNRPAATGTAPSTGPPRLTDRAVATLRAEWASLPPADTACLRAAAVFDTPCAVELLAEVAQLPAQLAGESAWRLVRRDLLRVVPATARFTFRHPVLRSAVRQDTDPAWRVEAHHRALTALLARGAPPAERVAQVDQLLGLPHDRPVEPYVEVLCRAAREIRRDAPELAVRWLRRRGAHCGHRPAPRQPAGRHPAAGPDHRGGREPRREPDAVAGGRPRVARRPDRPSGRRRRPVGPGGTGCSATTRRPPRSAAVS